MSVALLWFRQDLRLADNPALLAAVQGSKAIIPVYIWSPEEEGAWPPGAASRWWIHESLAKLDASLRERGSRLLYRQGPTVEALLQLAAECGATRLYWNRRFEPAAVRVEHNVARAMDKAGLAAHGFRSALLSEPGEIKSQAGSPYQIFTPYWRRFIEQVAVPAPQPSPRTIAAPISWPTTLALKDLNLLSKIPWYQTLVAHWQPGEAAARDALKRFTTTGLRNYAQTRDRPDLNSSSRLSACLHHGELSPAQVWTAIGKASERTGEVAPTWRAGKFCAELIWREFAAQQLHFHPTLPDRPRDARFDRLAWQENQAHLRAWSRGQTGYPMVDAGMRELWQTGWMHNRVRMITASFLIKNLLLPWQEGERWFWDTLVDADLASNALNWQWVAGTSPDAAPFFRIFNPESQGERFDPDGVYRRRFVVEAGTAAYCPPLVDLKFTRDRALTAYAKLKSEA
jgi:deoxyribodipyrimidine photo-lyase